MKREKICENKEAKQSSKRETDKKNYHRKDGEQEGATSQGTAKKTVSLEV